MGYGVYSVASEAYELDQACRWWVDLEWYTPYYYCGRRSVVVALVAGWLVLRKIKVKSIFRLLSTEK